MNVIYVAKRRLGGIDNILPVLMELKTRFKPNIIIAFPDRKHMEEVKRYHHIWEALESIGAEFYVMRDMNVIRFLFRIACRRNVFVKNSDILPYHKLFMRIVKNISVTTEVKVFITPQSVEAYTAKAIFDKKERSYWEWVLKPLPRGLCFMSTEPGTDAIPLGYVRRLPEWEKFVESHLPYRDDKYCVLLISALEGERFGDPFHSIDLLVDILLALRSLDIHVVIKPHVITDMQKLRNVLATMDLRNYSIDYGHPHIVCQQAYFVISYTYSHTQFDTFYSGVPVVLYSKYPEGLVEEMGGCEGGTSCDYLVQDIESLNYALDRLTKTLHRPQRNPIFIDENYPVTPQSTWDCWQILLGHSELFRGEKG